MAKCIVPECSYPRATDSWVCGYHETHANGPHGLANGSAPSGSRPSKYNAQRTDVNGRTFASKAEADRYRVLHLCEQAGTIRHLVLQKRWPLVVNEIQVGTYVSDFDYEERVGDDWRSVTEDVKGVKTPSFMLKAKLMKAIYGIDVRLTTKRQSS